MPGVARLLRHAEEVEAVESLVRNYWAARRTTRTTHKRRETPTAQPRTGVMRGYPGGRLRLPPAAKAWKTEPVTSRPEALVTGVGRKIGIGAGIAARLAHDGWHVATNSWDPLRRAHTPGDRVRLT